MPLIEDPTGESLLLKRLGITFVSKNGCEFFIDSEPVVSSQYDIAVFIDSLESDSCKIDSVLKKHIIWRVFSLAKQKDITLKFFDDKKNEIIPIESEHTISNQDSLSIEKNDILNLIQAKKYDELNAILDKNRYLLKENFGFNQESLLHFVSKTGNKEICERIIDLGIDVNKAGKNNDTPLVRAAEKGNLDLAKLLIKKGAKIDGLPNGDNSPLIAASGYGHLEFVKFLLAQGADIYKVNNQNQTAMQVAQYLFQEEIVLILKSYL